MSNSVRALGTVGGLSQSVIGFDNGSTPTDPDLVAGNIKKDVNILGITGTYTGFPLSVNTSSGVSVSNIGGPGRSSNNSTYEAGASFTIGQITGTIQLDCSVSTTVSGYTATGKITKNGVDIPSSERTNSNSSTPTTYTLSVSVVPGDVLVGWAKRADGGGAYGSIGSIVSYKVPISLSPFTTGSTGVILGV